MKYLDLSSARALLEMETDTTYGRSEGSPTLWLDCAEGVSDEVALRAVKDKIGEETNVTVLYEDEDSKPQEFFGWTYSDNYEFYGSEDEVSV